MIGRLRSYPLTVAGAMLLGLLVAYAVGYLPVNLLTNFQPVIPMGVLFVALLVLPHGRLATARFGGKTRRLTSLRGSVVLAAAFVAGTWVFSGMLSAGNLIIFGKGIVLGVVMLSLVLLTGYGGQVSLCQMTFAGVGAFCMGKILGGDSVVGLSVAFLLPALVGGILAVVVLRLRGIYLALATLAFAYAMDNMFFNKELGVGGVPPLAGQQVLVRGRRGACVAFPEQAPISRPRPPTSSRVARRTAAPEAGSARAAT